MLELWLIRHAESEGNARGDDADTGLSVRGVAQAEALAVELSKTTFDAAHSSDMRRCIETAERVLPRASWIREPRLREFDTGPETLFVDPASLSTSALEELAARQRLPAETGPEFVARVRAWLGALPREGCVLACTHTQVIREVLTLMLPERGRSRDPIPNASATRLRSREGRVVLVGVGERLGVLR